MSRTPAWMVGKPVSYALERKSYKHEIESAVGAKGCYCVSEISFTPEQILMMLAAAPSRIAEVTDGLSPAQLCTAPAPDEWSANEVLAHLRACADVWGGCIVAMLAQDHPTLRAVNPRSWIKKTDYPKLDFRPSLRSYSAQRAELLAVLEPLPPEGWLRAATVTGAGAALERTVRFYAQWLARHERPHLKQIARIATTMRQRVR